MFWRQFIRYKSSSKSLEKLSEEVKSEIAKIRTRIQIIESESECKTITDKLNSHEKPIAVDLEAVQKSPGLVQVADFQDNIYLFRTGLIQNGPKWFKIVKNGPKWSKMVQNGFKWSKIVLNGPKKV